MTREEQDYVAITWWNRYHELLNEHLVVLGFPDKKKPAKADPGGLTKSG
jgi:hypothetical protein